MREILAVVLYKELDNEFLGPPLQSRRIVEFLR